MRCITRYDMKFGDVVVPARTECIIANNNKAFTVNAPGVHLSLIVDNYNLKKQNIENENKVRQFRDNINDASLSGIVISTSTQAVYMDAADRMYSDYMLYYWQLEKIFGEDAIPKKLVKKDKHGIMNTRLQEVIDYLEDEFSDCVSSNCEFIKLTEQDIEDGFGFEEAEVGDQTLSQRGIAQFEEKCLEYKNKLEATGFTYDFKGGLCWEE